MEDPDGSVYSAHSGDEDIEMAKLKEEMDVEETERLISDRSGQKGNERGSGDIPCKCSD